MRKYKRIFLVVIDSLGIGAMKDAAEYEMQVQILLDTLTKQ